jgi:uncharacterized repeat protein (TIGR01451 family)
MVWSTEAQAAGTPANTTISNTVSVDYQVGGVDQTTITATATFVVDDVVDLMVTNTGGATIAPGSTDRVLAFTLTNTGNRTHGYSLTTSADGGNTVTMTNVRIYRDVNTNGAFDSGTDTLYTAGTNIADVAADATINIVIVADTPAGAAEGEAATLNLIATTLNQGTTTATTEDNGVDNKDTVQVVFGDDIGSDDADEDGKHSDGGTYTVASATLSLTKTSAVISDPFNGGANPKRIPGAIVRYTVVISNSGSTDATSVVATDPIPANTTYQAGTITFNTASRTDAADADNADYNVTNAGEVTANIGTLVATTGTATFTFDVAIQ